jgi:hypothetical protein
MCRRSALANPKLAVTSPNKSLFCHACPLSSQGPLLVFLEGPTTPPANTEPGNIFFCDDRSLPLLDYAHVRWRHDCSALRHGAYINRHILVGHHVVASIQLTVDSRSAFEKMPTDAANKVTIAKG